MIFHLIVKMFYLVLAVKEQQHTSFYSPRLFQNLYTVAATGGKPVLVTEGGIEYARYNAAGKSNCFQDRGTKMPYVNTTPAA
jgi:arabinogalactan endo-1,4-beta-galactosidase